MPAARVRYRLQVLEQGNQAHRQFPAHRQFSKRQVKRSIIRFIFIFRSSDDTMAPEANIGSAGPLGPAGGYKGDRAALARLDICKSISTQCTACPAALIALRSSTVQSVAHSPSTCAIRTIKRISPAHTSFELVTDPDEEPLYYSSQLPYENPTKFQQKIATHLAKFPSLTKL